MKSKILIFTVIISTISVIFTQEDNSEIDKSRKWIDTGNNVTKIFNDYEISGGEHVTGNLKIIGGDLTVMGTVSGEITVIGGSIYIHPTAVIKGRIVSIGGEIELDPGAIIQGEIVELGVNEFSISREDEDTEEDEDETVEELSFSIAEPYNEDSWTRYNRSEGFYLQGNIHIQSDYIPGLTLFGGVGRSFHIPGWRGTLGFEQFILKDRIQIFIEGYDRSHTDDTWRISDKDNSMSAFFIHQDFLDWYRTIGYRAGVSLHLPRDINLNVSLKEEEQDSMPTVVSWSMFGGDKEFRNGYLITPGTDKTVTYGLSVGTQYNWMETEGFSLYLNAGRTETQNGSNFSYSKDQVQIQAHIPFKKDLGFHLNILSGNISGNSLGLQHQFHIGGIGSLRGYDWKSMAGNQFLTTTVEILFDDVSVFYDRGLTMENSAESLFNSELTIEYNKNAFESMGISIGDEDACRIDVIKPLTGDNTDIKLNLRLYW